MNVIENSAAFVMWGSLIILNLATIRLLTWGLGQVNVRDVLREKDPNAAKAAMAASLEARVTGSAGEATGLPLDATSYSRVAGFVGTIVMASFLWALSNIIVYKAFVQGGTDEIQKIPSSVGSFFLAGASLFAAYAFNQIKSAFQR
jgi:hypothetical protein